MKESVNKIYVLHVHTYRNRPVYPIRVQKIKHRHVDLCAQNVSCQHLVRNLSVCARAQGRKKKKKLRAAIEGSTYAQPKTHRLDAFKLTYVKVLKCNLVLKCNSHVLAVN